MAEIRRARKVKRRHRILELRKEGSSDESAGSHRPLAKTRIAEELQHA